MSWDEIARSALQSIIQDYGGLVAALIANNLITTGCLLIVVFYSWRLLNKKQVEIDRMASEKQKLEQEVLKRRLSSGKKKNH